jgi:hypothetical protein
MVSRRYILFLQTALLLLAAQALVFAPPALAQNNASSDAKSDAQNNSQPAANPARPTITNPATLTPVGYLQFEQGYLGSLNSPHTSSQHGLNQSAKITVHPRVMLEVQSQPFAVSKATPGSASSNDAGDVLAGAQVILWNPPDNTDEDITKDIHRHAYVRSALPTIAFTWLERVHAGSAADIDLGSQDRTALFLFSGHAPGLDVHYDINIIASQQSGDVPSSANPALLHHIRRGQFAQTFSVDRPFLNPNLQWSAEIYHFTQPLVASTSKGVSIARANLVGALLAISYQLRPELVLDTGFEHGITSTSTQWQFFAGFTYLLPHRLWPAHAK